MHLVQLNTAKPVSKKTKEKIVPGNSWVMALSPLLQPEHQKKSVPHTSIV